jgi:hypothetical protein
MLYLMCQICSGLHLFTLPICAVTSSWNMRRQRNKIHAYIKQINSRFWRQSLKWCVSDERSTRAFAATNNYAMVINRHENVQEISSLMPSVQRQQQRGRILQRRREHAWRHQPIPIIARAAKCVWQSASRLVMPAMNDAVSTLVRLQCAAHQWVVSRVAHWLGNVYVNTGSDMAMALNERSDWYVAHSITRDPRPYK